MSLGLSPDEAEEILSRLAEGLASAAPSLENPTAQPKTRKLDYEARYKALVERIPAVVFVAPLDAALGSAYVSPQIETILGFTQDEWLGDPLRWYQQVHPDDKQRWSVEAASLFSHGQPLSSTYRVLARDGDVVWFQCDARMVHDENGVPLFIHGIGFDVSELKEGEISLKKAHQELESRVADRTRELAQRNAQLKAEIEQHKRTERELKAAKEAAEQAARIKSEFLTNMSHEIRTPMNGVLGLTQLVLETELSTEQREYLSTAYSSAESLLGIINQVLDFSKLEAGKAQLDVVNFELRESLEALVRHLSPMAKEKRLEMSLTVASDVPEKLRGDWSRLEQVLTNLIGNAIKFTHSGGVRINVARAEGKLLEFSVSDTGLGIAESNLKVIFEPFRQADGSVTRKYGGTGLGLAVSKDMVELMGGRMTVRSSPGVGSVFTFTACFETVLSASAESSKIPRPVPQRVPSRALRILIVEDNLVNQKVVSRLITKAGHAVTLANNGSEAVDLHKKSEFDLILMDVQMPVMDGLTATEAIRAIERDSGVERIPIIALTAHALESDRLRCLRAGMDAYASKPFKIDELLSLIDDLTKIRTT